MANPRSGKSIVRRKGRQSRPTSTDKNYRTISIIPQQQQTRMNTRVAQVLDTGGEGDETYVVGLSSDGSEPISHYVADMLLNETDLDNFLDVAGFVPQADVWIWLTQPDGDTAILEQKFGRQTNVEIVQKDYQEMLAERGLSVMNARDNDGNIP